MFIAKKDDSIKTPVQPLSPHVSNCVWHIPPRVAKEVHHQKKLGNMSADMQKEPPPSPNNR